MTMKTPIASWHEAGGGRMVEFAGWHLPVMYEPGILTEHLTCRKYGGIFDISHMGRFMVNGPNALSFLKHTLTNDASRLKIGLAQYTLISDEAGRPLDDAYLFRFQEDGYLLVVNGANREKDWEWLKNHCEFGCEMRDATKELAMFALQGPRSQELLTSLVQGDMPVPGRNNLSITTWEGAKVLVNRTGFLTPEEIWVSRTGYSGEPLGFELFMNWDTALPFWEAMVEKGKEFGIIPIGLGARDTLRLEALLPLYGHELKEDRPIMTLPQARFGVNLKQERGDFIGRDALLAQKEELASGATHLMPRQIMALTALKKGMMREGSEVWLGDKKVGDVTSGTTIPAWRFEGDAPADESYNRAAGLAYLDRGLEVGQEVSVVYRKRSLPCKIVKTLTKINGNYLQPVN